MTRTAFLDLLFYCLGWIFSFFFFFFFFVCNKIVDSFRAKIQLENSPYIEVKKSVPRATFHEESVGTIGVSIGCRHEPTRPRFSVYFFEKIAPTLPASIRLKNYPSIKVIKVVPKANFHGESNGAIGVSIR